MLYEGEVAENLFGDKIIIQNPALYRFTSDSILLSRFARAKSGDIVADFCSGSGVVGMHFLCLNPKVESVTLFEMQPKLSDMAERSARANGFLNVFAKNMRVQDIGREYDGKFSLILCNPPYEKSGFESSSREVAVCRKEIEITLPEIAAAAFCKLKFGGRLAICNRADRTAELLYELKRARLEPKRLQFVSGASDKKPYLVLVEAVKGGREGIDILPLISNQNVTSY